MKAIPSYGKIFQLGAPMTDNALVGEVIVQEKIDGSQFGFGLTEDKEISIRSKGKIITDQPDKMFENGWSYVMSIADKIKKFPRDTYIRGEYLKTPKHNTLVYERTPKNHIILFDALLQGRFANRYELLEIGEALDLEVVPQLFEGVVGEGNRTEFIKDLIAKSVSCLGGDFGIEGVVVKNYNQTIMVGGQVMPLFTKFVQDRFKERNDAEWKTKRPGGAVQEFVDGFKSPGRFEKAYQHLRDNGDLEFQLRDIPKLVKEVQRDIAEEEEEYIKEYLFNRFISDINRTAVRGLAEWYKDKLLENVK